jgi:hypothetical protein
MWYFLLGIFAFSGLCFWVAVFGITLTFLVKKYIKRQVGLTWENYIAHK